MIDDAIEEIREMRTHSSSAVAVTAARALATLGDREFASVGEYRRSLERNAGALRRANPSHASLHNATAEIVEAVADADPDSVAAAVDATEAAVERVVERVESGKRRAAERAAERIDDGAALLTHDYSSTVLEAVDVAVADGKHLSVHVSEARPRYLGRKTARTLAGYDPVDTTLVVDSAWGHALERVDAVYVGMDCIVGDTLYNRVGTFPLCAAADRLDVPVYVVGSSAKLIDDGFVFENEFRPASEVLREPVEGFEVENPAYDATPTELVTAVVTDEGVREL